MKTLLAIVLIAGLLGLGACGSSNTDQQQASATGNWTASLTNSVTGQQTFTFNFGMNQNGNNLAMTNMSFPNMNNCFGPGSVMSGQMTSSGMMMGMQMQMSMEMWSNSDKTGNHLSMQMSMPSGNNNQMSGTYTLTGVTSGCTSQTGTVTMNRMM